MLLPILGMGAGKLFEYMQARRAEKFNPILKRVRDAKAAGVHPLSALGAGGIQDHGPAQIAFGESLSKMGQNIGGAIDRNLDQDSKTTKALLLEKAQLETELLRAQVTRAKREMVSQPTPPALDQHYLKGLEGQGQAALPGTYIAEAGATLPRGHKIEPPQHTPNLSTGFPWRTHPLWSDGQTWEDRYGESAFSPSTILNWGTALADVKALLERNLERYPPQEHIYDKLRTNRAREMHYRPGKYQSRRPEYE